MSLLDVRGLSVSFGADPAIRVLEDVSLSVDRNEIVCLVGESGSGKSVAAMSCVGLTRHAGARVDAGSVRFDGRELVGADTATLNRLRGGQVGFIFQEPMTSLNPAFTVGDQIGEVLRLHLRLSRAQARAQAIELLAMVGLSDPARRVDDYPHHLSGGMRQRVMIAIAIAAHPRLLIADEPTTALDLTVQAGILDLIRKLRDDMGMGVLLITHDFGVVAEIADKVVVMYAGQVIERAPAELIFERPHHPYTSGLLTSLPQLSARGERFGSIPGTVPSPARMPSGCRFHPRCPHCVRPGCTQGIVPLSDRDGSQVRCVRADELLLEGT